MAPYAKLEIKEGSEDTYIIANVVESETSLGSDYILLSGSNKGYGIRDEYNSTTQQFTKVYTFFERNKFDEQDGLDKSDWTVLPDVGLTAANVVEWKAYRASLRAIRKNPSSTEEDTFPSRPDIIYED